MPDRMMQRRDASLRRMARHHDLAAREPQESFRSYYRRVAEAWLAAEGDRWPLEAETVRRLLSREDRRSGRAPARGPAPPAPRESSDTWARVPAPEGTRR